MSVITIARQFGSGGKSLGEMISKKLGYFLYDNELIQLASIHAKVSEKSVSSLEKDSGGKARRFFSGIVPKSLRDMLMERKEEVSEEVYVDVLTKIILDIAEDGNAVIIGRGSQYILHGKPNVINLLVIAEKEDRIKFMEQKYDLSYSQAVQSVEADDRRRANLYRKFNKTDYDRPETYHVVINTSKLDLDSAANIICDMVA